MSTASHRLRRSRKDPLAGDSDAGLAQPLRAGQLQEEKTGAAAAAAASVLSGFEVAFDLLADGHDSLGVTDVAGPRLEDGFVQHAVT